MKRNKKYSSYFIRRISGKAGSALIWALAVALILAIVLAAGLNMVQRQQNQNVQQHIENQAYFTAMSVTQAVVNWFSGTAYDTLGDRDPAGHEQQIALINWLIAPENQGKEIEVLADLSLGETAGEYKVFLSSDDGNEITVRTVATYAGATESVIGTLTETRTYGEKGGFTSAWPLIEVPPPPMSFDGHTLKMQNGDEKDVSTYSAGVPQNGVYKISNGSVTTPVDVLIATNPGATNNNVITLASNVPIGTLIISANTMVIAGNGQGISVGTMIIEAGGVFNLLQNGTGIQSMGTVHVLAGGRFLVTNNSNLDLGADFYVYASDYPNPPDTSTQMRNYLNTSSITWPSAGAGYEFPAYIEISKVKSVGNVIFQPSRQVPTENDDEDFVPSYPPRIPSLADIKGFKTGAYIHIPYGFMDRNILLAGQDYATVRSRACTINEANFRATCLPRVPTAAQIQWAMSDEVRPFCPHFSAKNEPPIEYFDIVWGSTGGYSRG